MQPAVHGRFALSVTSLPHRPTVHGQVRPAAEAEVVKFDNVYGQNRGNLAYRNLPGLADGFTNILVGCFTLLVLAVQLWSRLSRGARTINSSTYPQRS